MFRKKGERRTWPHEAKRCINSILIVMFKLMLCRRCSYDRCVCCLVEKIRFDKRFFECSVSVWKRFVEFWQNVNRFELLLCLNNWDEQFLKSQLFSCTRVTMNNIWGHEEEESFPFISDGPLFLFDSTAETSVHKQKRPFPQRSVASHKAEQRRAACSTV